MSELGLYTLGCQVLNNQVYLRRLFCQDHFENVCWETHTIFLLYHSFSKDTSRLIKHKIKIVFLKDTLQDETKEGTGFISINKF